MTRLSTLSLDPPARIVLPQPIGVRAVVRSETQRWQRLGRAEGELILGWGEAGFPVRVEYHWIRWLSRADPAAADVYTAELWARRPAGDWLYLVRPGADSFQPVPHDGVRRLLRQHLDVEVGD